MSLRTAFVYVQRNDTCVRQTARQRTTHHALGIVVSRVQVGIPEQTSVESLSLSRHSTVCSCCNCLMFFLFLLDLIWYPPNSPATSATNKKNLCAPATLFCTLDLDNFFPGPANSAPPCCLADRGMKTFSSDCDATGLWTPLRLPRSILRVNAQSVVSQWLAGFPRFFSSGDFFLGADCSSCETRFPSFNHSLPTTDLGELKARHI